MQPWTITQMKRALIEKYLPECQTATERHCCTALFRKELKEFVACTSRKLTPCEAAILDEYHVNH